MKLFVKQILFLAWAMPSIGFSQETTVDWKSGLTFQSTDANFKMKIGGRIQYDHAFYTQNDALESIQGSLLTENGTKFRRAWLSNVGTLYDQVDFGLFVSFEGGKVGFRGAYMGLKKIPFLGKHSRRSTERTFAVRSFHKQQTSFVFGTFFCS